ncbi:hypothetical protein ABZ348_10875 [Streptomyces sp. NPDC005963]
MPFSHFTTAGTRRCTGGVFAYADDDGRPPGTAALFDVHGEGGSIA